MTKSPFLFQQFPHNNLIMRIYTDVWNSSRYSMIVLTDEKPIVKISTWKSEVFFRKHQWKSHVEIAQIYHFYCDFHDFNEGFEFFLCNFQVFWSQLTVWSEQYKSYCTWNIFNEYLTDNFTDSLSIRTNHGMNWR